MAEFKTRLFIFFAGKLLRWAGSIEREITDGQSAPAPKVDDGKVLFDESSHASEAASGPPEHWTRLVASSPPQHWIDLVKDKAPQLLPLSESLLPSHQAESFGQEDFKAEGHEEAKSRPGREDGAVEKSKPPLLPSTKSRRKTDYSWRTADRSNWLNRLRFQPPASRGENADAIYVSDTQTQNPDAYPAAGGAAEEVSDPTLLQPTRSAVNTGNLTPDLTTNKAISARQTTLKPAATPSTNSEDNTTTHGRQRQSEFAATVPPAPDADNMIDASRTVEPGTQHYPARRADTQYINRRHVNSEPVSRKSLLVNPLRRSPAKIITEPVTDTRHADQQHPFLERGTEYVTNTRTRFEDGSMGEPQRQSSEGKRGAQPKELDLVQSLNLKKPSFLAGGFPRRRMNQPAVESDQVQSWSEKETNRNQQIHHNRTVTATGNGPATLAAATAEHGASNNQGSSTAKTVVHVV
ncbi:MAG TPA: hypothetical protein VIF64_12500, partial [Pyrinomonadaceae bacterium]